MDGEAVAWSRALSGDGDAFGEVFDRHRDQVYRYAWRLTGSRHDAEDVLASAFLELWRRRKSVRVVDGSVLPWLLVTTLNLARNVQRSTRRYRRLLDRLPRTQEPFDDSPEPGGPVDRVDADLAGALRSLKGEDLLLVSLVWWHDLSLDQAAAVLGLSQAAAKARLYRARRAVRAQLDLQPNPAVPPNGDAP